MVISRTRVAAVRMGNIRQTYIKRVAIDLIRHYPEEFTGDFTHNKQKVLELTDLGVTVDGQIHVVYKKLANRIAGYATRYMKRHRGV
jgi:small subunit ribosomal protein S17e